ncbi:MAG TPA: ComEC/Rec2 family competence protein [Candidatus Paceibacterota bacterium]
MKVLAMVAGGFALGVFVRSLYALPWEMWAFVAAAASILLAAWFFVRRRVYVLASVTLIAMLVGIIRVALVPMALPSAFARELGKEVTLTGTVVAAPDIRDTNARISIEATEAGQRTRVLAVVSRADIPAYGAQVTVRGKLEAPKPFATEYGRTFRYDRYLAASGIYALMPRASVTDVMPPSGIWPRVYGALIALKQTFLHAVGRALPEPEAALAGGIVAGGTQGLGASILDDFVRSGLVHVVVLSGYNVMIVAEVVLGALVFLSAGWAAAIASVIIALFVLAAGAGAASVRAGLMAGFALLARATGRTYDVTRALIIAVLLMLLWNPLLLAFSLGFDLSVIATLGLILGVPLIEPKLAFVKSAVLRETIASTTAAQVAVLPLLLYSNGLFSVVSLPANVLVLPFVPPAMAASAFAGAVALVLPALAPVAGLPAYALLGYIIGAVHVSAALPFAAFAVPAFSLAWVIVSYILLALLVRRLGRSRPKEPAVLPALAGKIPF